MWALLTSLLVSYTDELDVKSGQSLLEVISDLLLTGQTSLVTSGSYLSKGSGRGANVVRRGGVDRGDLRRGFVFSPLDWRNWIASLRFVAS